MEDLFQKHLDITDQIMKSTGAWNSYADEGVSLESITKTLEISNTPNEHGEVLYVYNNIHPQF